MWFAPITAAAPQLNDVTELKQLNIVSSVSTVETTTADVTSNTASTTQLSQINSTTMTSSTSTVTPLSNNTEVITSQTTADNSTSNNVGKESKPESNTTVKSNNAPKGHSFKSYTSYRLLNPKSKQGKLQQLAYSDENGLRKVGEYYCVALGSYYGTNIGDCYIVTLSSGNTFKMTLCDAKADIHTDSKNQYTVGNGCMTEFYVDYKCFDNRAKRAGNISVIPGFEGDIVSIEKLDGINVFNLY